MIKSLRTKFTIIAMCSMFLVLATIMAGLNILNYRNLCKNADHLFDMIATNKGTFPKPPSDQKKEQNNAPQNGPAGENSDPQKDTGKQENNTQNDPAKQDNPSQKDPMGQNEAPPEIPPGNLPPEGISQESPYDTRFFTIWLDKKGKITATHLDNIAAVTESEAKKYAKKIYQSKKNTGFLTNYRYKKIKEDTGTMIIFLDRQNELSSFRNTLLISLAVSAVGLFAVFILVVIFSKIVFRPVEESYKKQKRFITDASHEIKTPLTIIDANLEVVEMLHEESEWTKSIRNQIKRLSSLTKHLVMLSKLEEKTDNMEKETFSLSELVEESVQSFSALVLTKDKDLETHIDENISYTGDEKAISQLIGILLDNAIKYALPETTILVTLKKQKRKIRLEVYNKAEKLPKGNLNVLFERFYRTDTSRNSKTGGSGIGLSVAHAIVEAHKGTIVANSEDGKSLSILVKL